MSPRDPAFSQPTSDPGDATAAEPAVESVATPAQPAVAEPVPSSFERTADVPLGTPGVGGLRPLAEEQAESQRLNAQLEAAITYAKSLAGSADTAAYDSAVAEVGRLEKLRG